MFPSPSASARPRLADGAIYLLGTAGLSFSIAVVWLGMRAVMGVGGFCAEGGPYVIETPCPAGAELMFLAFPLGFASAGAMVWKGGMLGGAYGALPLLAWPAIFLSLGWNFLEAGLNPAVGSGPVPGWVVPGVVFVLMGGGPLWLVWRSGAMGGRLGRTPSWTGAWSQRAEGADRQASLDRLERLRSAGMLTSAEYEAARSAAMSSGETAR